MYSKVTIKGHPIHPMLVAFPVALYTVTLISFIVAAADSNPFWFRVGVYANIAGVVMAALAAIPGFVDWAVGIPRGHRAKTTGLQHMMLNVTALIIFLINALVEYRHLGEVNPPYGGAIVLPLLGVLVTVAAGWLGWTLVQTHHVGVQLTPMQTRLEPEEPRPTSPHQPRPAT